MANLDRLHKPVGQGEDSKDPKTVHRIQRVGAPDIVYRLGHLNRIGTTLRKPSRDSHVSESDVLSPAKNDLPHRQVVFDASLEG